MFTLIPESHAPAVVIRTPVFANLHMDYVVGRRTGGVNSQIKMDISIVYSPVIVKMM